MMVILGKILGYAGASALGAMVGAGMMLNILLPPAYFAGAIGISLLGCGILKWKHVD